MATYAVVLILSVVSVTATPPVGSNLFLCSCVQGLER